MSKKINELPPYVGATNPIGDIPISINGVTYRITPQLAGQTLQQVLDTNHELINGNNFQGTASGDTSTGSNINAFGILSFKTSVGNDVNAFGYFSAFSSTGNNINALGVNSALGNSGSEVNALGTETAKENTGNNINAFGTRAAQSNTGSEVNAFGKDAGKDNQLNGQTIFSNTCLPYYATYADADADITIVHGASAGCTYLFYNEDKKTIDAIRL